MPDKSDVGISAMPPTDDSPARLFDALQVWLKIGLLSFGGPAAQIGLMHREIVTRRRWLTEQQYLNALSFCMLLPGPEAMQLATYAGWRRNGILGGLIAGSLFVIPGAIVILLLAISYVSASDNRIVGALFLGIKAAVIAIVMQSVYRMARKTMKRGAHRIIAGAAFIGIFFLSLPFPLILAIAAITGAVISTPATTHEPVAARPRTLRTLVTILVGLVIWLGPLAALTAMAAGTILPDLAVFFAKLAVVTFGGAYAVLAYMGQEVVTHFHWLTATEMMDGLGLAETTPGPLILVTEFVGFIAGYNDAAGTNAMAMGVAASLVTLWATFVPCFLWIFAGAPYIEWIVSRPRLQGALTCISAAVVGVIGNLAIWFALHVFFHDVSMVIYGPLTLWTPDFMSMNWPVIPITAGAAFLVFRPQWD